VVIWGDGVKAYLEHLPLTEARVVDEPAQVLAVVLAVMKIVVDLQHHPGLGEAGFCSA